MKTILKVSLIGLILIISGIGLVLSLAAGIVLLSPDVTKLKTCMTTNMFQVEVCPGSSQYVKLSEIPESLIDALIVSEDAAFFTHSGFDWFELKESLEKNIEHKSFRRGGSTITQQLAKNAFLSSEKSIWRKLKEAYITYRIEASFSKREILEKYLNIVEFGENLYGIKKASDYYFGKHPRDLHLLESSFLIMMLPSPKKYSESFRSQELTPFARRIIKTILDRLVRYKKISPQVHSFALENLDMFPWRHLSQADFYFSLPELPQDLTGELPSESVTSPTDVIDQEIRDTSEESTPEEPAVEESNTSDPALEEESIDPESEAVNDEEDVFDQ